MINKKNIAYSQKRLWHIHVVGQGPVVLAASAGRWGCFFFFFFCFFFVVVVVVVVVVFVFFVVVFYLSPILQWSQNLG